MGSHTIDSDDLLADLALLRKNHGFIQRRLVRMPLVEEVLRARPTDSYERLRSRFVSAIASLDPAEADLLLDVYALSPETERMPLLNERRKYYADRIRRGIDTVADRETPALEHLLTALVTGRYAQSPLTLDVPEMHGGIIYETTSTLIVVENRHWKQTRERYRFAATFDEMDYLTITRSYPARATAAPDGRFTLNTRPTSRGFNDHFWHRNIAGADNEPMRRGETYELRFKLEPDEVSGKVTPIVNACRAFHERSLLASIQVRFIGERPTTIWRYERVSFFAQPGQPSDTNRIEIDDRGVATLRLRDVHGGLFSGMAWTW